MAVLRHQYRERDDNGRIIAEIDDYVLSHELVVQMYETSVTRVSDKLTRAQQLFSWLVNSLISKFQLYMLLLAVHNYMETFQDLATS